MQVLKVDRLFGMDERPNAPADHARLIRNMRYDAAQGCWIADRGFRSYFFQDPGRGAPSRAYSCYLHQTLGGATKDLYMDLALTSNATTLDLVRFAPFESDAKQEIISGRHLPGVQEPAASFTSFGRVCVTANGWDAPLRLYPSTAGSTRAEPFGFSSRPAPPTPAPLSEGSMRASATAYYYSLSLDTFDVTTAYPTSNTLGLGNPTANAANAYRYIYTWVTDTGSESPPSEISPTVSWTTNSAAAYRYGIFVSGIQPGPAGTVKRRLYRTANLGTTVSFDDATFRFVADIPNNFESAYTDHVADAYLGSNAPTLADSAPLPGEVRWVVAFAGRMWIVAGDYRVHWSQAGQIESFGADNFLDVSTRSGGRVTGLVPFNDLLVILRESSIEVILQESGTFRAAPVVGNVGSRAPHAAITIPSWGLLFVADDGIYVMQGNLAGGGQIRVTSLTDRLDWSDFSTAAIARSWAWYNAHDRDVTFAIPALGGLVPNANLVLHLENGSIENPCWSNRALAALQGSILGGPTGACGVTGPEGWPYLCGASGPAVQPVLVSIWGPYDQIGYLPGYEQNPWLGGSYTTTDLDLGDSDALKYVAYVTATVATVGNTTLSLSVYLDGGWRLQGETQTTPQVVLDREVPSVYGSAVIQNNNSHYDQVHTCQVRFDLNVYASRRIRLLFSSTSMWAFYGYTVHFEARGPNIPMSPNTRTTTFSGAPSVNVPVGRLPGGVR